MTRRGAGVAGAVGPVARERHAGAGLLLLLLVGCSPVEQHRPPPPPVGKVTVVLPSSSVDLFNGATAEVPVEVRWIAKPAEDLTLRISVEPENKGVTARLSHDVLATENSRTTLFVTAYEIAAPGRYRITVTARAAKAGESQETLTAVVPNK